MYVILMMDNGYVCKNCLRVGFLIFYVFWRKYGIWNIEIIFGDNSIFEYKEIYDWVFFINVWG